MRHVSAKKDVEIQEGPTFPDFPRAGAGPSHEVKQTFLTVLAGGQGRVKREAAIHICLCLRPIEPFGFCVDVEGPNQAFVGFGARGAEFSGFHGHVKVVPSVLKQRSQPWLVHEKEHQLEAHALSACFACFKPRSQASSKGEVEA